MKNASLDTIAWFQEGPGVRNTQYTKTGVKLINVTNLVNGVLNLSLTTRYISEKEAYGKYNHFLCDSGDLVIASSGITYESIPNKVSFVREQDLPLCMNTSVIRFKCLDDTKLNIRYLFYFFKSNCFRNQISKLMTGSAQLNFGPSHLHKIMVPLCDLEKQNKIVKVLDSLFLSNNSLEKESDLLDELLKTRFYELFGDSHYNEKDLKVVNPEYVCKDIFAGGDKPEKVSKVQTDNFRFPIFSNGEKDEGLYGWSTDYRVAEPAITVSGRGTIGYSVYRENGKFTPIIRLVVLIPNNRVNPYYLTYYLNLERENGSGSGVHQLTVPMIKEKKILLPDLDSQNRFANYYHSIQKLKDAVLNKKEYVKEIINKYLDLYFENIEED